MNVIAPMAGICNGDFLKKFTNENVDVLTLGGYATDMKTYNASVNIKNLGRDEFIIKPDVLNYEIKRQADIIHSFNPHWNGLICVNLRGTSASSFTSFKYNDSIDILEVNAHCRQPQMCNIGAGEALLRDVNRFRSILEEVSSHTKYDLSVKIRANVNGVDTLEIIDIINEYPAIKYIHIDAMKPGIPTADYELLNQIRKNTKKHIIANNSVTSHEDYLKMLSSGADSVSVARAAIYEDVRNIFK